MEACDNVGCSTIKVSKLPASDSSHNQTPSKSKIMKFVGAFILAVLAFSANAELNEAEKEQLKQLVASCLTKTGVDQELISKARSHEYSGTDPNLAAYYSCMLGGMGFQKEDGSFDVDRMVAKLPENAGEIGITATRTCATSEPALSKDKNAMNFVYCFYKNYGKGFKLY